VVNTIVPVKSLAVFSFCFYIRFYFLLYSGVTKEKQKVTISDFAAYRLNTIWPQVLQVQGQLDI